MRRFPDAALTIGLWIPLLALAGVGLWSRPVADDLRFAAAVTRYGWLDAQRYWFACWFGRFSFTAAISALAALGAWTVPLTPALVLASWAGSLYYAARARLDPAGARLWALLGAALPLLALPPIALAQVVFWQTGALVYLFPLALLAVYVGALLRPPSPLRSAGGVVLVFIAGGFSETQASAQCAALGLALVVSCYIPAGQSYRARLALGLVASLTALGIMTLAPGNAVRQAYFPPVVLSAGLGGRLLAHGAMLAGLLVLSMPLAYVAALMAGAAWLRLPLSPRANWLASGAALILLLAAIAPASLMMGQLPPPRAWLLPALILLGLAALLGAQFPADWKSLAQRTAAWWIAALVVIGLWRIAPLYSVSNWSLEDAQDDHSQTCQERP